MNVAILGASPKPDRYAHKAQRMLAEHGHTVFPVSPTGGEVLGRPGYRSILDVISDGTEIDTVTVYINPARLEPLIDDLIAAAPRRVILNPGTESETATARLQDVGIQVIEACTLVLLVGNQFESA